ncbi:MAG: hypothetical protein ACXWJ4_03620 [Methyloceanibacter sp.]
MTFCFRLLRLIALIGVAVLALPVASSQLSADAGNPFSTLLGSWGGSGEYRLQDGTTQRVKCNAYYTGGGTQLGMVIRCSSDTNKIEIRSKLSSSGGRITGSWEERTYNAEGSASGSATGDKINLQISGAVNGTMQVAYTASRQSVSISTQGVALRSVNITLGRS